MTSEEGLAWQARAEALAGALKAALYRLTAYEDSDHTAELHRALARLPADALAERELPIRKVLWLSHGCPALYGDDGEMQCGACCIDFKRDPWQTIGHRLAVRIAGADQALAERRALAVCETVVRLTYAALRGDEKSEAHDVWITAQQWGLYSDDIGTAEQMLGILAGHAVAALAAARKGTRT